MQRTLIVGVVLWAVHPGISIGQVPQTTAPHPASTPTAGQNAQQPTAGAIVAPASPDPTLAAIAPSAKAFLDAFNGHDAKAIAALWTEDGEYVTEAGNRITGRAAIEDEYAKFFTANPKAEISFVVDRVRQPAPGTLLEEGRAIVKSGERTSTSRYTVVHKQVDGKWQMASVRDSGFEASADAVFKDLDWLVGSWSAEGNGNKVESTCRWLNGKKFLERKFSVTHGDQMVTSGVQIIGWNPQSQEVQSWIFTSEGGQSMGIWTPCENGWSIETHGMLADGTPTRAINQFTRVDDRAFAWKSVNRSVGETSLPDTDEVILRRVDNKPAQNSAN